MVSIKKNLEIWNDPDHWETGSRGNGVPLKDGEKWSAAWGGSKNQWDQVLHPRISSYIPSARILEIAPGYGRWTQYLLGECKQLTVVDLAPVCIEKCKERFKDFDHIEYMVNDGKSLVDIEQDSVDFIFSFDSLVHVDIPEMRSYVEEFYRVLKDGGVCFFHHSNLGEYGSEVKSATHLRSVTVSADNIYEVARSTGFGDVFQECIPWSKENHDSGIFLDCMTVLKKSPGSRDRKKVYNKDWRDY